MNVRVRSLVRVETALLAVALAILAGLGYVQSRAEDAPPKLDSYSSYDAASGGYRAAYELLEREGARVERFERRPAFLDSGIGTLVYAEPIAGDPRARAPSKGDIAALEAWVRDGGRLLYIGDDEAAARAGILHLPHLARQFARERAGIAPELRALGVARVVPPGSRRYAAPRGRTGLLVGDRHGAIVLAYSFGRGDVVATIDRALFSNAQIAAGDRARLFVALARSPRRTGVVAFDESPHGYATPERWWQIVPRPFLIALGVALGGLLVAIAGAAVRLGPPLVPAPRDDRGTADFVTALAALYERNGDMHATLRDAAAATSRTIVRATGLPAAASNDDIAARLADTPSHEVFATLRRLAGGAADRATLVRGVALAQQLRKEFIAHGRSRN